MQINRQSALICTSSDAPESLKKATAGRGREQLGLKDA